MDGNQMLKADFNDIVFENRNKDYGAYQLRRIYPKHVNMALTIATIALVLLLLSPYIAEYLSPEEEVIDLTEKVVTINELDAPPPLDETKPPPPPVNVPPPPEKVIKYVPPKIVKEEVIEEPLPTMEEIKETKTSTFDQDGDVTLKYEPPKEQVIEKKEPEIFEFVDQYPEFSGSSGMDAYLRENINYPQVALENNITGTVFISAVIGTDGAVSDVKILKDIGGGCGTEAKRVVERMPKWKPGKQNGKPVPVRISIPVKFVLR